LLTGTNRVRTKTDIIARIIEVAKERPVTKTRIAYDCFLSYDLLNEYLETLTISDLLKFNKRDKTYIATKRGLSYLDLYEILIKYLSTGANSV
jgi:predicted transcriptional regulator